MKILAGAERADEGDIMLGGEIVRFSSVRDANERGLAIVFQELSLFPDLDLIGNIFLLRERRSAGIVRRSRMEREIRPLLDTLGLHVPLDRPVGELTIGEQQLVEIAKALHGQMHVLILDEPNSSLNAPESEHLFAVLRDLRDEGVAIIYVSHRLEEVFQISDRITVLRDGLVVASEPIAETTISQVVEWMIGRSRESRPTTCNTPRVVAEAALLAQGVSIRGALASFDLAGQPGEVIGLAGLEGAGQRVVFEVLSGRRRPDEGTASLPDGGCLPRTINEAVRRGVAIVPADRRTEGAALDQNIAENVNQVTAGALGRLGRALRQSALLQCADEAIDALQIRGRAHTVTRQLSGGNQQKVVLAKWLAAAPSLLLLDDPTRGVDVGAKQEIYDIVARAAAQGALVLVSTSELPEYRILCDRVLIFYRGSVCHELVGEHITEHRLLHALNTGSLEKG